jgi:hypothetical protein
MTQMPALKDKADDFVVTRQRDFEKFLTKRVSQEKEAMESKKNKQLFPAGKRGKHCTMQKKNGMMLLVRFQKQKMLRKI